MKKAELLLKKSGLIEIKNKKICSTEKLKSIMRKYMKEKLPYNELIDKILEDVALEIIKLNKIHSNNIDHFEYALVGMSVFLEECNNDINEFFA